jgi:hypothetical protein
VPDSLVFIPSREKAILAAPVIEWVICNRWENKPRVRDGTQLDLPIKNQKSSDTNDPARLI